MTAYSPNHAFDVPPGHPQPGLITLFFRRLNEAVRWKKAVPAVAAAGAAAPPEARYPCCFHCNAGSPCEPRDNHLDPCVEGCNDLVPVLEDKYVSQVRAQWNAWHDDDVRVPRFTPSAAMDTGEFAVLDEKVDAVLRPVNGRSLPDQPRRTPAYGEAPQLAVERDMAHIAGLRARTAYKPPPRELLQRLLEGVKAL